MADDMYENSALNGENEAGSTAAKDQERAEQQSVNFARSDVAPGEIAQAEEGFDKKGYAGFWKRAIASLVDGIVMSVVTYISDALTGLFFLMFGLTDTTFANTVTFIIGLFAAWLYYALLESSSVQATLGKLLLGIKVVDLKGRPISFARATGRLYGKYLSFMILGIGILMVAFTKKKQGLHDIIAGCLVINK